MSTTIPHRLPLLLLSSVALIAACSGSGGDTCGGFVEPTRILSISPGVLTLDIGAKAQLNTSLSGGCANDSRVVTWASETPTVATVSQGGEVTALAAGITTIRATAFDNKATSALTVTVKPKVATSLDARPDVDTLSPLGTRALTATVLDQNGDAMTGATVVWRSLSPTLASVTASGTVTAITAGAASILASAAGASADSLRDTVRVLVVPACDLVRPVPLGTTFSGSIDASTCQNLFGFRVANQYSVTSGTQAYFSIRLVPTRTTGIVPLNLSSGLIGLSPADTATTAFTVIRAGTFGFMIWAPATTPSTYTVTTALNPDPRTACVTTDATFGVTFNTALTPSCQQRDIRLLPALSPGKVINITATAPGHAATIELRNVNTGALIQRAVATSTGGTATIAFTNTASFPFVLVRLFGGAIVSDLVTMTIAP
jgi:Bacterial Ig-like domain (group 2)